MKFNTKTIHGGQKTEKGYGAVMPPIYQTSTYAQKALVNIKDMNTAEHITQREPH